LILIIDAEEENAMEKAMCGIARPALFCFAVAFSASVPALARAVKESSGAAG
jgi:hypothetical protein